MKYAISYFVLSSLRKCILTSQTCEQVHQKRARESLAPVKKLWLNRVHIQFFEQRLKEIAVLGVAQA